jgi:hypothetical protein
MSIQYEFPILFDSNENNGAINKNSLGSSFEVDLDDAIEVPAEAKGVTLEVYNANIWYTTPNITVANNKFYFEYLASNYTITFPDGLYDLQHLEAELQRQLVNLGLPKTLISFQSDGATQKIQMFLNGLSLRVDFTQPNTIREILGFDSVLTPPGLTAGPTYFLAQNEAKFNNFNYYLIHVDILNNGIPVNGNYNSIAAKVDIDVAPGSLINFKPWTPLRIPCTDDLAGKRISSVRLWITDELNRYLSTANENWSVTMVIRYYL